MLLNSQLCRILVLNQDLQFTSYFTFIITPSRVFSTYTLLYMELRRAFFILFLILFKLKEGSFSLLLTP